MAKRVKEDVPFMQELHRRINEVLDTAMRRVEVELGTEMNRIANDIAKEVMSLSTVQTNLSILKTYLPSDKQSKIDEMSRGLKETRAKFDKIIAELRLHPAY